MSAEQKKKPSKISDSLLKTIQGSSKEEDIVENDEAFAEADNVASINQAVSSAEKAEPEIVASPEPDIQSTKKSSTNKISTAFSVLAFLMAVIAGGMVGYLYVHHLGFEVAISEDVNAVEGAIGDLTSRADKHVGEIAQLSNDVSAIQNTVADINAMRSEVGDLKDSLIEVQSTIEDLSKSMGDQQGHISEHGNAIETLQKDLKILKDRHAAKKIVKTPVVKKPIDDPTKIEGASVASIDLWGTEPYVVLREDDGGWVPLTMGDYYRGWRFAGATEHGAMFKRGGKKKTLQVEE